MQIALTLIAALTSVTAPATENPAAAERRITVCLETNTASYMATQAKRLVSQMFAAIGLTMDWRKGLRGCPAGAIVIVLDSGAPPDLRAEALGVSLPFDGRHIRLFYRRIAETYSERLAPMVLGHVMVHEITHLLQGIDRHSESGVMKAHWSPMDCSGMARKPLEFTAEDIDLIYAGLAKRAARAQAAMNATPDQRAPERDISQMLPVCSTSASPNRPAAADQPR